MAFLGVSNYGGTSSGAYTAPAGATLVIFAVLARSNSTTPPSVNSVTWGGQSAQLLTFIQYEISNAQAIYFYGLLSASFPAGATGTVSASISNDARRGFSVLAFDGITSLVLSSQSSSTNNVDYTLSSSSGDQIIAAWLSDGVPSVSLTNGTLRVDDFSIGGHTYDIATATSDGSVASLTGFFDVSLAIALEAASSGGLTNSPIYLNNGIPTATDEANLSSTDLVLTLPASGILTAKEYQNLVTGDEVIVLVAGEWQTEAYP